MMTVTQVTVGEKGDRGAVVKVKRLGVSNYGSGAQKQPAST